MNNFPLVIDIKTLDDVDKVFTDDSTFLKWLSFLRWGEWAQCPYCHNPKAYFIENGTRYKCANKKCYKKFSVTVKTMLEASNIKLRDWVKMFFLYAKTRGRISSFELCEQIKIAGKTEFWIREKLEYIWSHTDVNGKFGCELMIEMIKSSFVSNHYENFKEKQNSPYYKNPFHISEITDIGDPKQYNILVRYIRYFVNVYAHWIFLDFASPQEILSEVFLYMKDSDIKEYNAESILKHIWLITDRMWRKFLREHPKYSELQKIVNRRSKERRRRELKESYLVDQAYCRAGNTMTRQEIKRDKKLLSDLKERILLKRKQSKSDLTGFHSHFD